MTSPPTIGLVLSGGGARGAYEVGVLSWIAQHCPQVLEQVRVISGSSVGAVNGTYLASHGITPAAVAGLERLWRNLIVDDILRFSPTQMLRTISENIYRRFKGHDDAPQSLFHSPDFQKLVTEQVDWTGLRQVIQSGRLDALAISATEIGTGRTHVFIEKTPTCPLPHWAHDGSIEAVESTLDPGHILASCSLPFLFTPVRIRDRWYTDGGLRQNTPLSPALRLGAERLLVISLTSIRTMEPHSGAYPGMGQLLGKLFNSLFLDRTLWDLARLRRLNEFLEVGEELYGDHFTERMEQALARRGHHHYRHIHHVTVRPGSDIGAIAFDTLHQTETPPSRLHAWMRRRLTSQNMRAADAASYLLFDGSFTGRLIELGYADAAQQADALRELVRA